MRKILLIVLIVVILTAGGWYWYAKSHQTAPGVPAITDFSAFFPIGESGDPTALDGLLQDQGTTTLGTTAAMSAFKQISASPIAGFITLSKSFSKILPADPTKPKSKPTTELTQKRILRYVSRANGYVYEVDEDELPLQISNVYIPNIYEALFGNSADTALLRFLRQDQKTIATYSVPIPPANLDGTRTQKEGVYFPDGIVQSSLSPDGLQIAYQTNTTNGATITLANLTNTKKSQLLQTPFREWSMSWPTPKALYLQTKASASVPGFLYRVSTTDKKLVRVLGDIPGLTTSISPSGTYILYSQSSGSGFSTQLLNIKTNTTRTLNLAILPEKCTWLANEDLICGGNQSVPEAQYPDAWYQGVISFRDTLVRISTSTLTYETLYDGSGTSFDMTGLQVDEQNRFVYFIDKPTGLLWRFAY